MERDDDRAGDFAAMLSAPSALGYLAAAVRGGEVVGIAFGHRNAAAAMASLARRIGRSMDGPLGKAAEHEDHALAGEVLERLQRFADGEPVDLDDIPVALDGLTTFQRRVVKACRAIPRGQQRSYGEIAASAGSPGAARAVGQVMRSNRTPLVVPCHRVVAAGGRLGGFSAPDGLTMKRRLLKLEAGVTLTEVEAMGG